MQRDLELIREILIGAEKHAFPQPWRVEVEGHSAEEIYYHVQLMDEAGLVTTLPADMRGTYIERLTNDGHEFLDAARQDTVWQKVMEQVKNKGGSVSLEVVTALLLSFAKQSFGLDP